MGSSPDYSSPRASVADEITRVITDDVAPLDHHSWGFICVQASLIAGTTSCDEIPMVPSCTSVGLRNLA